MAAQKPVQLDLASSGGHRRVRVALVMPVRNEEAHVRRTLDAIFDSSRLPDEIVIADGMSRDDTASEILRYQERGIPLRVLPNPAHFSGAGRNIAIAATTCEVIVLADFGNTVDREWLAEMVRPFEEETGIEMVAGPYRPLVCSAFEHCVAAIEYYDEYCIDRVPLAQRMAALPADFTPGSASLALTRRVWEICGGCPEWLFRAQDKLFTRKARLLGVHIVPAWSAVISHHMRDSGRAVFAQFYSYGRGNGQTRLLENHVLKLLGFYAACCALLYLLVVGVASTWILPCLLLGYWYRRGLRKLLAIDGGLRHPSYLLFALEVLLARDCGSVAGHLIGWTEWFLVPKYKKQYYAYMLITPTH